MATNYPTSLDNSTSLPYPSATSARNAPSLAGGQDNQNDSLIALQTKLGIGASTPTSGKFLTGTGTGTSSWANTVPAGTVVGTSDSQTLTNKTLTSPTISSPTITNATISTDLITGYTTSNTGTVYGIPITTGVINTAGTINGASLVANSVTNASILTGNLYASKFYNPYKFSYYLTAAQNSINGFVKVNLDTKLFDTSSNFDAVTNHRFTAPVAGFYQFNWAVGMSSAAAVVWQACLYKGLSGGSSSIYKYGSLINLSSNYQQSVGTGLVQLGVGDFVELYIYCSAVIALGPSQPGVFLEGYLVSAT